MGAKRRELSFEVGKLLGQCNLLMLECFYMHNHEFVTSLCQHFLSTCNERRIIEIGGGMMEQKALWNDSKSESFIHCSLYHSVS